MKHFVLVYLLTTVSLLSKFWASGLDYSYSDAKILLNAAQIPTTKSEAKLFNVHFKRQVVNKKYKGLNNEANEKVNEKSDDGVTKKGNIHTEKVEATNRQQDVVANNNIIGNTENETNNEDKQSEISPNEADSLEFSDIQDILFGGRIEHVKGDEEGPLVSTAEGDIRGERLSVNGVEFDSFLGIPYAAKPERFQAAKPHSGWNGTLRAFNHPNICTQRLPIVNMMSGSEDCLYMNIATPSINATDLPVLLVVHGGAFKFQTGNTYVYDPQMFMRQSNVIVASFNYRLGALGFISTRTADAPGNVGMKDIIQALRWVQRNIHNFGGDRLKVTLYGVSSGAAAIEFLLLSKMAKGMFSGIIIQSGSALNYINYQRDPLANVFRLGKRLGEETADVKKLIEFLKNADADDIMEAADEMDWDNFSVPGPLTYVPSAEDSLPGEERFLDEHPYVIMRSGDYIKVPSMIGFNDLEGSEFTRRMFVEPEYLNTIEPAFEYLIPSDLMETISSLSERREIMNYVRDVYFHGERISNETIRNFANLMGDQIYLNGLFRSISVRLRNSEAPIYFWQFSFPTKNNIYGRLGLQGASHADDVHYLFEFQTEKTLAKVSEKMLALVTNFIMYRNPTPNVTSLLPVTWYPIQSKETLDYLAFNGEMQMKQDPYRERRLLWECIYSRRYGLIE